MLGFSKQKYPSKRKKSSQQVREDEFLQKKSRSSLWLSLGAMAAVSAWGIHKAYRSWQCKEARRVSEGGLVVNTTLGPVEYQITGSGPVVIYAHGTPGGYDQGLYFARFLGENSCTLISPSRPGYLRTPLASGATPEAQADLYAALLDALGIEQASVIGFSGGGPSALQFALRHPERCQGLIMIGAIARRYAPQEKLAQASLWTKAQARLIEYLLVSEPFLFLVAPIARLLPFGDAVEGMLCSGTVFAQRKTGYDADYVAFAAIEDGSLESITAPALIIHGSDDPDVPVEDAELLARKIKQATLFAIEGGDHASFYTQARIVMPMITQFLRRISQKKATHTASSPSTISQTV